MKANRPAQSSTRCPPISGAAERTDPFDRVAPSPARSRPGRATCAFVGLAYAHAAWPADQPDPRPQTAGAHGRRPDLEEHHALTQTGVRDEPVECGGVVRGEPAIVQ